MNITNNSSPSFGSIQVGISKMGPKQKSISDRLFNTIKYTEKYSQLEHNDLDIYMLANGQKGIKIRFLDPYSGNFVRDKDGKIIQEQLFSTVNNAVEAVTNKVVDTYEKIVKGIIARPKENISDVMQGKTDLHKVNPGKAEDFSEAISDWKSIGYTQEEAEVQAFEEYKSLYHCGNKDADF